MSCLFLVILKAKHVFRILVVYKLLNFSQIFTNYGSQNQKVFKRTVIIILLHWETESCLILCVLGKENNVLPQESLYLHGILYIAMKINQEHLSLVCKHKHMLKHGAPPDNF